MHKPRLGSISEGTLLSQDLLAAFATELEYLEGDNGPNAKLIEEAYQTATRIAGSEDTEDDSDNVPDLINDLMDRLNDLALPYTYFGTDEGDGACFGFWPSDDAIAELPRVSDPNGVEAMGEDCVYVNDHGNTTIYAADGSIIWDCV